MTTYYQPAEIKMSIKKLVDVYLADCKKCEELPPDFTELIKHNFLAKFVYYNKSNQTIEIGIEDNAGDGDFYPQILVYKHKLKSRNKWLDRSFKNGSNDLAFYGKLLNRSKMNQEAQVILI
ncbi:MAG: hypothetical protein R6W85_11280 [Gillisia sp.]